MHYPIAFDDTAKAQLPGISPSDCEVVVADITLAARFGDQLQLQVGRAQVAGAEMMADLRPHAFLPYGVSSAVRTLGTDTLAAIGSRDNLVRIDFAELVSAQVPQPHEETGAPPDAGPGRVPIRHLVVSLQDPDGFLRELAADPPVAGAGDESHNTPLGTTPSP